MRGARFLDDEAIVSVTEAEFKRCDAHVEMDMCIFDSSILHRTYLQRIRITQRLIQATGRLESTKACGLASTEASDQ
jgi:hypothetical protein